MSDPSYSGDELSECDFSLKKSSTTVAMYMKFKNVTLKRIKNGHGFPRKKSSLIRVKHS